MAGQAMDLCSHAAAILTLEAPRAQAQAWRLRPWRAPWAPEAKLQGEQWALAERGDGDDEAGAVWATFA